MLIFILLAEVDKRTVGYRRRKLSIEKGTHAMLALLGTAKKAAIPAKYVLFDSWFSSPIFKMHRHLFKCDQSEKMI